MKKNKAKKVDDFTDRAEAYQDGANALARRLQMNVRPIINFKKGNVMVRPSLFGKFALFLLRISGGFLDTHFTNLKK